MTNPKTTPPFRFALAQYLCRSLPPIIAMRLKEIIYPERLGQRDNFLFLARSQTGGWFKGSTVEMHALELGICGYSTYRNWAIAIALCNPGDTILEVGANIGTETVGFADIVGCDGHVYAFEPFSPNVESLKTTLALTSCQNVTLLPIALGDKDGIVEFVPPKGTSTGTGRVAHLDTGVHLTPLQTTPIGVQCAALDSLRDRIPSAAFICMDAEDSEVYVLRGAANYIERSRPSMVVEAHRKVQSELHAELQRQGYIEFSISRYGLKPVVELAKHNANWFCVHQSRIKVARYVNKTLLKCVLMPCLFGMNPMRGIRRRKLRHV